MPVQGTASLQANLMASARRDVPLMLRYDTSETATAEVWLAQGHVAVELVDDDGVVDAVDGDVGEAHAADVPGAALPRLDPHPVLRAADQRVVSSATPTTAANASALRSWPWTPRRGCHPCWGCLGSSMKDSV